jgi:hypothetical protein
MPDGYTVLPMRDITTTRTIAIFMGGRASRNFAGRQSRLCTRPKFPSMGLPKRQAKKRTPLQLKDATTIWVI